MGKFLKRNWFVVLMIILFTGVTIFYIYDTNKGKLKGKSVNGEDVVYSIADEDVTTSEFYEELYKNYGTSAVTSLIQRSVADQAVETTSSMKETAASQAASILSNYVSTYGDEAELRLAKDLAATGYSDLEEYLITAQKLNQVTADYAKANFDDLKIREVSYILIKFDDSTNPTDTPTETEQAKMDAVDAALAEGKTFAEVAAEYSEDDSTASNGGVLGIIDKNTSSIDTSFLEAALALSEGEVSTWVRSSSFGYFLIEATAATPETLEKVYTESDPYLALVSGYDTTLSSTAIWNKIEELGIDFNGDTELESKVKAAFGIEDDTTETEAEATAAPEATATPAATAEAEASATAAAAQ